MSSPNRPADGQGGLDMSCACSEAQETAIRPSEKVVVRVSEKCVESLQHLTIA